MIAFSCFKGPDDKADAYIYIMVRIKQMTYQSTVRPDEPNYVPYVLIMSVFFAVIGMTITLIWASQGAS